MDDDEEDQEKKEDPKTCAEKMVIHPQKSGVKKFWDFVIFCCLAISLFFIPFTLAFDTEQILQKTRDIEFTFDVIFTLNIILNFFTAY